MLIECGDGLVLVDTGFGTRDVQHPRQRLSGFFLSLLSPDLRQEMTAVRQIEGLGWSAKDVRHIVLTHLDFDHAGGLDDFPGAMVHLMRQERDEALLQKSWLDRQRYRPAQWRDRSRWRVYQASEGERWHGFERARQLDGLPPEIALVPLVGHTLGHAGVAVESEGRWLLQAGDAYFHRHEMNIGQPRCPPGLRLYQWLMEKDRRARLLNQQRLLELKALHGNGIDIVCAHDVEEFERCSGRPAGVPAAAESGPRRLERGFAG